MNAKEIRKELAAYGVEFKNSPVDINVNDYRYHKGRCLSDCYKNYSVAKFRAYRYCTTLCGELNGENCGVRSYNWMMFTYHFTFTFDNKQFYCVITKAHNYAYPIGDKIV